MTLNKWYGVLQLLIVSGSNILISTIVCLAIYSGTTPTF